MEESALLEKCVLRNTVDAGLQVGLSADVFGQHAVAEDVDFQRVFPTATSHGVCDFARCACHQGTHARRAAAATRLGFALARCSLARLPHLSAAKSFANDQQLQVLPQSLVEGKLDYRHLLAGSGKRFACGSNHGV